jgi:hypothetical protein
VSIGDMVSDKDLGFAQLFQRSKGTVLLALKVLKTSPLLD